MKTDLDDYISAKERAGQFHSSGAFTLSLTRSAREKLAAYQFDFEGAWVVKLVQAMVSQGSADEMQIILTQKNVKFTFRVNWCLQDVESAVIGGTERAPEDLEHLATSLRLLAFKEDLPFLLQMPDEDSGLAWTGDDFSVVPRGGEPSRKLSLSVQLNGTRAKQTRVRVNLTSALEQRCFASPVRILLDKRRVNQLFAPQELPKETLNHVNNLQLPLKAGFLHSKLPQWKCPEDTSSYSNTLPPRQRCSKEYFAELLQGQFRGQPKKRATFAFEAVGKSYYSFNGLQFAKEKTKLYWLKDGAVTQIDELEVEPLEVSFRLFCSADGLEHDISGLKLRETEKYLERKLIAFQKGYEAATDLNLYLGFDDEAPPFYSYIGMGVAGIIVSAVLPVTLMAKPVLMLASGALGMQASSPQRFIIPDLDDSLDKLRTGWASVLETQG